MWYNIVEFSGNWTTRSLSSMRYTILSHFFFFLTYHILFLYVTFIDTLNNKVHYRFSSLYLCVPVHFLYAILHYTLSSLIINKITFLSLLYFCFISFSVNWQLLGQSSDLGFFYFFIQIIFLIFIKWYLINMCMLH